MAIFVAEGRQEQALDEGTDAALNRNIAGSLAEHLVGLIR
jgi:hypothetical protein